MRRLRRGGSFVQQMLLVSALLVIFVDGQSPPGSGSGDGYAPFAVTISYTTSPVSSSPSSSSPSSSTGVASPPVFKYPADQLDPRPIKAGTINGLTRPRKGDWTDYWSEYRSPAELHADQNKFAELALAAESAWVQKNFKDTLDQRAATNRGDGSNIPPPDDSSTGPSIRRRLSEDTEELLRAALGLAEETSEGGLNRGKAAREFLLSRRNVHPTVADAAVREQAFAKNAISPQLLGMTPPPHTYDHEQTTHPFGGPGARFKPDSNLQINMFSTLNKDPRVAQVRASVINVAEPPIRGVWKGDRNYHWKDNSIDDKLNDEALSPGDLDWAPKKIYNVYQ